MNRIQAVVFAILMLWTSGQLWAGVFSRDWKTYGDGRLTFDDVNQREWLDIPATLLANFPGDGLEDRYQSVVAETVAGGLFEGFTVAKGDDVIALAESAGINVNATSLAVNETSTRRLIALLGETFEASGGRVSTGGAVNELTATDSADRLLAGFGVTPQIDLAGLFLSPISDIDDIPERFAGVFLFRPVPEPSTAMAMLIGMACLLLVARRSPRQQLKCGIPMVDRY